jgi:hypothetical protein
MTVARVASLLGVLRRDPALDRVGSFCLFIGHGRSGGTLAGALLNAHPNAVITNELDALSYIDQGLTQRQLFHLIYQIDKRPPRTFGSPSGWRM